MESEAAMMHNIMEFSDKSARDIMTHRLNIVALDGRMKLKAAAEQILSENNSRFPVYQDDMDNIVGIIHLRDVMAKLNTGRYDSTAKDYRFQILSVRNNIIQKLKAEKI